MKQKVFYIYAVDMVWCNAAINASPNYTKATDYRSCVTTIELWVPLMPT